MEVLDLVEKFLKTKGYRIAPILHVNASRTIIKGDNSLADFAIVGTKLTVTPLRHYFPAQPALAVDIYDPDSLTRLAEFIHALCVLRGLYC